MKLNKVKILELIDEDLIMMNKHPDYDLYTLNYTRTAQFEKVWNEYTLMCRGLVVDGDFNIIARPFGKFFNFAEHDISEIPMHLSFEAFEKMDGSLGVMFYYDNKWHISTRGSFISDQAIRAKEMLKNRINLTDLMDKNSTYCFEIIYPENRIVVNYGDMDDVVLLGVINTETGIEMPYDDMYTKYYSHLIITEKYDDVGDISKLTDIDGDNREGFIVKFSNGFRVKIKYEEYCRLHSIITESSNLVIWRSLKYGHKLDLDKIPDEFYDWVKKTKDDLMVEYGNILYEVNQEYADVCKAIGMEFPYSKKSDVVMKEFALEAKKKKHTGFMFAKFNEKDSSEKIWNMIRPVYSKPFIEEVDE